MVESWVVYVVIVVVVVGVGGPVAWLIYRHIQLLRLLRERRDYGTAEDIALESASRRGGLEPHQYNTSVATPHGTLHSTGTSPRMRVGGEERILAMTQQDNSHGSDAGQDGRRSATTLITIHQHNDDDEGGNDGNSEEDAQRVSGNASYVLQPRPDSPTELLGVAIENRIRPRHRLPKGTVVVQHADQQVIIDFSQLHDIPTAAPPPLSAEELQKLEEQRNRIASPELYGRAEYLHRSFATSSSFGSAHHASQLQQQSQQSVGRGAGSRPGSHTATPIRSLRQLTAAELAQLVDGYGYGSPHGSTASLASRSYRPGSLAGNSVRDADRPLRPLFLPQSALVQIPSQQQQQHQKSASPSSHASQKREGARRTGTQSSSHTDTARYSPQAGNGSSSSDLASRSPTHNNNNNNHSGSSSGMMVDEGRAGRRKTASQRNSQQQQQQQRQRQQRNGRQSYLYDLESTSDDFDEADAMERMREWEQAAQPSAASASAKARRHPTSRQDNSNNTQEEQQMSRVTGEAPSGSAQASLTQGVNEERRRGRDGADEQQRQQTSSNTHKDSNGAAVGQCSEAASHSPMQRPEQATTTTTNTTTAAADTSHVGQG